MVGSADSSQYLTEQEFNTGKNAFINMLTYKEPIAKKVEWKPSTVKEVQPLTLNRMTVKDLGQPPNLDVRKNANPHANTKWSLGRW